MRRLNRRGVLLSFWNPSKIADIQKLGSIQQYFTAKISGLIHEHYWDRIKNMSLITLQRRRERYIVIQQSHFNDLKICFTNHNRQSRYCYGSSISSKRMQSQTPDTPRAFVQNFVGLDFRIVPKQIHLYAVLECF